MSLTPPGNPQHLRAEFWIACMEAQVWEMKECLARNDFEHFFKEVADCIGVGFDCIRLLSGKDAMNVFLARLVENLPKFEKSALQLAPRDTQYYLDKIVRIKQELGVVQ